MAPQRDPLHLKVRAQRGLIRGVSLEGEDVLRAVVRSNQSSWFVTASIPIALAEAPLRMSLWLWAASCVLALTAAIALAWLFARAMG